jgi:hypothetical protein
MLKRPGEASNPEDFDDFVAEVFDDFDGDAADFGFIEGAGGVAVEGGQWALWACWTPADLGFSRMSGGRFVLRGGRRSRLLRRPWIEAGFLIDRRRMSFGGRIHWPTDLRSAADEWIGLLQILDRLWSQWPLDVASATRRARTYPEAIGGLRELAATRAAAMAARADTSDAAVQFAGMSPSVRRMISQGDACEGRGIEEPAQAASAIAG